MRRLIILALMSLVCTVPAAAELAQRLAKPAVAQNEVVAASKPDQQQNDSQSTQSIEKTLRINLPARVSPISKWSRHRSWFAPRLLTGIRSSYCSTPNSDSEWQVSPLDGEDDHSTSSPN